MWKWTPLTYRDELFIEGLRPLLFISNIWIYGFCNNKALYSASPSITKFIGPAAVARRILHNTVCPSFPLPWCFLGTGSLVFSKFWHGARNSNDVARDRTRKKIFFCPNTEKMKKWVFLIYFYWICSVMKIYFICYVFVNNLCLVKILFLRYGPKFSLPVRLQYF